MQNQQRGVDFVDFHDQLFFFRHQHFKRGIAANAFEQALSRAAQLDPKSAEIQSRLGIVLSQKGLRAPAEAAFRKALQLQPGYAPAHLNLAVLYASQQPPLGELAQWHYQKAVKAGSPKNPELEKLIETARAAAPK